MEYWKNCAIVDCEVFERAKSKVVVDGFCPEPINTTI